MKHRFNNPAWIMGAGAVVLVLLLVVIAPKAVWIVLSLPLILFLPGFAMTVILFPRERLGLPERLLLSVALSVALTALSSLVLNLTPWGLRTATLAIVLLVIIAAEVIIMFRLRRPWWNGAALGPIDINFSVRQWVLMTLAAVMAIMAIRIARTPAPPQGLEGYTLLWVQPADTADSIRVGVKSEEFQATKYQIKYQSSGITQEGPVLELAPGATWEQVVPVHVIAGESFTVLLYRLDNPAEVYRHAVWWPKTQ